MYAIATPYPTNAAKVVNPAPRVGRPLAIWPKDPGDLSIYGYIVLGVRHWNEVGPGYLEIDVVAHGGGIVTGAFIHSLVVSDVSLGWPEAVPLLAREQPLVVEGLEAISDVFPVLICGIDSDNDSVFINETLVGVSSSLAPRRTGRTIRHG